MSENVTQLLEDIRRGQKSWDDLFPSLYATMKEMAHGHLRNERQDHTLNTTALVHEAYMRLSDQRDVQWESRTHFLAIASLAMRRILLTYAQQRKTDKRKAQANAVELEDQHIVWGNGESLKIDLFLALDDSLNTLEKFNPVGSQIVEYRFFGGLTFEEISQVTGLATVTVRRKWAAAKAWLQKELSPEAP